MKDQKFRCVKGIVDTIRDNQIIVFPGDILKFIEEEDGEYYFEVIDGWCTGMELNFNGKEVIEHFEYWGKTFVR